MDGGADPVWTERPSSVSRENPVGVTTTRNRRLFNDLLYPLLSDAITYRLRYISFWAWVLYNTNSPDRGMRASYEKVFFLSNLAHECPDDGHSSNGIVGAGRRVNGQSLRERYDPAVDVFDLTADDFQLTNTDGSGFDTYYQSLMQRLWLLHGKMELTPCGEQVAAEFDENVGPSFDELRDVVHSGTVPQEFLQRFASGGCCCELRNASDECNLLTNALLANFERTDDPSRLWFRQPIGQESLSIDEWYPRHLQQTDEGELDLESLFDSEDLETDLMEYFNGRFGARGGASLLLFLATAERVRTPAVETGWDIEPLEDIRRAWDFFVYTHYFVVGSEALLRAWLHGVRHWEPIGTTELLEEMFTADEFTATVKSILADDVSITVDESRESTLWRVLDAIYYETWFDGRVTVELDVPDTSRTGTHDEMTWGTLQGRLTGRNVTDGDIGPKAVRVLHDLLQSDQQGASDGVLASYYAGVATVLLAQLYRRGQSYRTGTEFEPYRRWFDNIAASPSPASFWRTDYDESRSVNEVMQSVVRDRVVKKHHAITQRKMGDRPSQTPRHMLRRPDGEWEFKSMYSDLSQSWARLERLVDVLYELDLATTADVDSFRPTARGKQLLEGYGIEQ